VSTATSAREPNRRRGAHFKAWSKFVGDGVGRQSYDPAKAISVLKATATRMGVTASSRRTAKKGTELTVITNGGYSDWVADIAGREPTARQGRHQGHRRRRRRVELHDRRLEGQFQLAYDVETGGPSPFYEMRQWLYSKELRRYRFAGAVRTGSVSRAPPVDALLNQYGSTTSSATQHSIIDKLQTIMVQQLPVIPVLEEVDWFQYNSDEYSGFPVGNEPYAQPGLYNVPDWGVVVLHLKPKK